MAFYVQYKLIKLRETQIFNRISLFTALGLIIGPQYIICLLKQIEITKRLFVLELEQGKEVAIPKKLSQDELPYAFRFYDAIIHISQNLCSKEKRQILSLQMQLSKYYEQQYSTLNKMRNIFYSQ